MQKVAHFIANGWPWKLKSVTPDVKVYFAIRGELIVDNGVILKGLRVVVPNSLPKEYIQLLHKGHPGTDTTKRRAKGHVVLALHEAVNWLYDDSLVSALQQCKTTLAERAASGPPCSGAFVVSADIFDWLTHIPAGSRWILSTIYLPKLLFRRWSATFLFIEFHTGCWPTKNPQFFSREFRSFAEEWNFHHVTCCPLFSQSNGLVENAVKHAKNLLGK